MICNLCKNNVSFRSTVMPHQCSEYKQDCKFIYYLDENTYVVLAHTAKEIIVDANYYPDTDAHKINGDWRKHSEKIYAILNSPIIKIKEG